MVSTYRKYIWQQAGRPVTAERWDTETRRFLEWVDSAATEPAIVKAGVAHLWFVTVHPFDDGNGRIARALGELWPAGP